MQRSKFIPAIQFSYSLKDHLVQIWNMRISYPNTLIYLWKDNASGTFWHATYHPDVASTFFFVTLKYLFIPMGSDLWIKTFSTRVGESCSSPQDVSTQFVSNPVDEPPPVENHRNTMNLVQ